VAVEVPPLVVIGPLPVTPVEAVQVLFE